MSVSDRRVPYAPYDWSNCYVCETVKCRHVENWERALKEWKSGSDVKPFFLNRKILQENIPWRPERVCKHIPTGSGQSLIFQFLLRCRCIAHLKQVITNGETTRTKDITLQSKDSLISRKTKQTESDTFNSSLCRLSPFHLPYVKAMSLVGILP